MKSGNNNYFICTLWLTFYLMNVMTGSSQVPGIAWEHCYGGTSSDECGGLLRLSDGSYILSGTITSNDGMTSCNHGGDDFWIAKLDSLGILLWRNCIGGPGNEYINQIILCNDGGFLISGYTYPNGNNHFACNWGPNGWADCILIKLDSIGNTQWQHCYGGTRDDKAIAAVQLSNGDFIFAASTTSSDGDVSSNHGNGNSSDIWLARINTIGNLIWNHSFGSTDHDYPADLKIKNDNELFLLGTTYGIDGDVIFNHGSPDIWWLDIDTSGTLLRQKCFGGSLADAGISINIDSSITWILASTYSSDGDVGINYGSRDCLILKIDSIGTILQNISYGGTAGDEPASFLRTREGSFYFSANSTSKDGDFYLNHGENGSGDIWVFKCDSNANSIWQKNLGGTSNDNAISLVEGDGNSIVVAGTTLSNDDDVTLQNGYSDIWVVNLSETVSAKEINTFLSATIFPNPSEGDFYVQLNPSFKLDESSNLYLYDLQGKIVDSRSITDNILFYKNQNLKPGLYLFKIISNKQAPLDGRILISNIER